MIFSYMHSVHKFSESTPVHFACDHPHNKYSLLLLYVYGFDIYGSVI